ncbi:MAG TPA: helix-hairpin-helix domain-containing protein, partial [Actinomycetota bacterium]|nr:helix-hairpin-helix domain-containing protein [Actinomycetota bacterium]
MPRINDQVAAAFNELADLMEISGADRFRVLAYRRVASEIGAQARDLTAMSDKELSSLRGVGKATAGKIEEFLKTGTMRKLEDARASVAPGLLELTALPGLGPKTALLIHQELGVASIADLKEALKGERIRTIRGLGPKTEETLSRSLKNFVSGEKRIDLEKALLLADSLLEPLRAAGMVAKAEYAGSLRRMRETIGDIDILVASREPKQVGSLFGSMDTVSETRAAGGTKTTVITSDGMQADLRVVAPDEFGAALQYFTGSKEHNVRVREIAVKKGMKLSEYGLFKVEGAEKIAGKTESEVYEALGMQLPPPTMRENHGEIELALSGDLPRLIELKDVRGDLHSHSRYSDGMSSIQEMASAAADLGYVYYAITDHGGSNHVRSVSPEHLEKQIEEVEQVRGRFAGTMT